MDFDQARIDALVARPSESLNVEIKRWINPDEADGTAKIARAALALRNRNGGSIIIGFDNQTLQPDVANEPPNIHELFHHDNIQALISRYASELFEVAVAYGHRDGREYPVIVVPSGVKSAVAAKRDLVDAANTLIRFGDVYFRTLSANGTPSTAVAKPQDWPEIFEICFNNREADIGGFIRRQLAGHDLASILAALAGLNIGRPPPSQLMDRTVALLDDGRRRFEESIEARNLDADARGVIGRGSWQVALMIDPALNNRLPDQAFFQTIAASNPQYTGWPVWLDSRGFVDRDSHPIVRDRAWQAFIVSLRGGWSRHIDFLRFDPRGEFYLWRILQDDVLPDRVHPGTALDPILVILRVAEAIAVGQALANALGCDRENTRLGFAFRWTGLRGRRLEPWANPVVPINAFGESHEDAITTFVELSLDSAIGPFVDAAVRGLFVVFGGYRLPLETIEHWVQRLIQRQLP
jgi:hypothetical protein